MMELLFWLLLATVVYVYGGYPLALYVVTRSERSRAQANETSLRPSVTMLISAYNEESCIAAKLENCLELDYPKEHLEIIVISDASSDRTDEIVSGYAERGVRLLRMEGRGGKTVGLNAAVAEAVGEIIVFSDANAMYQEDAIIALTRPFADPSVGAVVGEQAYTEPDTESGESESLYWRYETAIKELESIKGSVVGGDGAIYSVRKSLYEPMRADALSDFVNPLQVVRAGYRCVYDRRAIAFEETAEDFGKEFRRKVRIVNRAWRAMLGMKEMLNPVRYGTFAIKLWSHKMLRWLVPFFLVGLVVVNLLILDEGAIYWLALLGQIVFYMLAAAGWLQRDSDHLSTPLSVPYYFCLVNIASAQGIIDAFKGETYTTWSTPRNESGSGQQSTS